MNVSAAPKPRLTLGKAAAFLVALLLGAMALPAGASAAPASTGDEVPGRILVKFAPGASAAAKSAARSAVGASRIKSIPQLGVDVLKVPATASATALARLQRNPNVAYAESDRVAKLEATAVSANDPDFSRQWGLTRTETTRAWSLSKGSAQTKIAILDTGVNSVPDLRNKLLPGRNTMAGNNNVTDTNGHGTWAAGVAGAQTNNAGDVASYCWSCSIIPVKVMDSDAGTMSDVAAGITWASDQGAAIISMSLSGASGTTTLHNAVKYAQSRGVLLVAAAGNQGGTAQRFPAAYPEVVSVAGTDSRDVLYSWSNYGSWVDVSAPGSNRTTNRDGGTIGFGGTSSATPAVAGIAGLAMALPSKPSAAQVRSALNSAATSIGNQIRYGRVDALATLNALGGQPTEPAPAPAPAPAAPTVAITSPSNGATVTGTVTVAGTSKSNDAASVTRVDVTVAGTTRTASGTTSWSTSVDTTALPEGTHRVTAKATTSSGGSSSTSVDVTVKHPAPEPAPEPTPMEPQAPAEPWLKVATGKVKGANVATLTWDSSIGASATVWRDGVAIASKVTGTSFQDNTRSKGGFTATYQVCSTNGCTQATTASW